MLTNYTFFHEGMKVDENKFSVAITNIANLESMMFS